MYNCQNRFLGRLICFFMFYMTIFQHETSSMSVWVSCLVKKNMTTQITEIFSALSPFSTGTVIGPDFFWLD